LPRREKTHFKEWFDKLTTNGGKPERQESRRLQPSYPLVLSLSKDLTPYGQAFEIVRIPEDQPFLRA